MSKKDEKKELQTRRQFFKKAVKGILPFIGAIVLSNYPIISKSIEEDPMGCRSSCAGSCVGSCYGTCTGSCRYTCSGTCKNSCTGCRYECTGTCKNSCSVTCLHSSQK